MSPGDPTLLTRALAWAETANRAPSGDNSQPWAVSLTTDGDRVVLTLALDEATRTAPSIFDCAFAASHLSLGTFARNFQLMAGHAGHALTSLQETAGRFTLVFAPAAPVAGDPAALIRRRTTNRLPFKTTPLDEATHLAFAGTAAEDGLTLRTFTGPAKTRVASAFAVLDRFRYRHAPLYFEFLDKLRFGVEADRSPDGLRDTTLGVPAPSLLFLRLLRAGRNLRALRAPFFLGFDRVMAFFGCVFPIRRSAAVFMLSGGEDTPLGWFRLGLGFQALWLEATRRNLAFQPLGTTLLLYRLEREARLGPPSAFSPAEHSFLAATRENFRRDFGLEAGRPAIAFRVGHAPGLENTSLRRPFALSH